jgi:2-oxoisovalerate dehydrogenase E2 component (dihydrolipoyl transacylase)
MADYLLPDVGEGLTEAEIVSWKVKVGDVIAINDVVVEIETAKSLVELPSPYAGTVAALLVPEGQTVAVGTPIISVVSDDEVTSPELPRSPAAAPAIDTNVPPSGEQNTTLVGYGPREAAVARRPRRSGVVPAAAPMPAAVLSAPAVAIKAKPPVRKLAKDLGVDLATLTPTGPNGAITRADVEGARSLSTAVAAPVAWASSGERETREPIKGVRKMMATAMVSSAFSAPHVTEWVTFDITRTMEFVERLKADREFADVKVSPLLVVAAATLLALRRTPAINSFWDEQAQEVVVKHYVNLGIAAATPRGLVVPNVKHAQELSLSGLASALTALATTAREGRTQPADMADGTFTITNVGVFGIDSGTPIINPGESAILAVGAIRKQPWVVTSGGVDQIVVRQVTTLALSFDHRHIDGELGSRFLADVAGILADPATAMLF